MEAKRSREEIIAEKRAKRKPIATRQQKLAVEIPDGFEGRWVNDRGRRIPDFIAAGWDFIDAKSGGVAESGADKESLACMRVDKIGNGEPLLAYLMVIEKELYDEDQRAKARAIDETVDGLRRGTGEALGGRIDGDTTTVDTSILE